MSVLASYNIKGGVGKTTTAVNIAYQAAKEGYRTLVWDLDPQGAASFYFRIKPKIKGGARALAKGKIDLDDVVKATDFEGLDLIPADFSYRKFEQVFLGSKRSARQLQALLKPVSRDYDLLVLDCPPGISLMSENIFFAANALLIPLIPTTLSVRTYHQLLEYLKKAKKPHLKLLPFFSMYNSKRPLHREIIASLPMEFKEVLKTAIPDSKRMELTGPDRVLIGRTAPLSKPARAYAKLWNEIRNSIF